MPLRLPPLSPLRFFEAAGRHRSFKLAAEELNVTPSAVSHGVVGLEEILGVALFVRQPRSLALTAEGAEYLPYVSEALSLIAIGTQRLASRRTDRGITVSCAPTLASRWLLPRLGRFKQRWPAIGVTVDTSHRQVGFPVDGFDFAIRMSRATAAGTAWTRLFGERLVPVASPAYRTGLADADSRIDLGRATLLHVLSASEDWPEWLERCGVERADSSAGLRFDTIQLAFEAAAAGLGVALGRRPLVDRDLADGRLVELGFAPIEAETAYWLVSTEGAERRSDLVAFKRWIIAEAEAGERIG